jgi:hypothetical protein
MSIYSELTEEYKANFQNYQAHNRECAGLIWKFLSEFPKALGCKDHVITLRSATTNRYKDLRAVNGSSDLEPLLSPEAFGFWQLLLELDLGDSRTDSLTIAIPFRFGIEDSNLKVLIKTENGAQQSFQFIQSDNGGLNSFCENLKKAISDKINIAKIWEIQKQENKRIIAL